MTTALSILEKQRRYFESEIEIAKDKRAELMAKLSDLDERIIRHTNTIDSVNESIDILEREL